MVTVTHRQESSVRSWKDPQAKSGVYSWCFTNEPKLLTETGPAELQQPPHSDALATLQPREALTFCLAQIKGPLRHREQPTAVQTGSAQTGS